MRPLVTPNQFSNEQNNTANRTCGCFDALRCLDGDFTSPKFFGGRATCVAKSASAQTTCGTHSRLLVGGALAGETGSEVLSQPHSLRPASASQAQQSMVQCSGSFALHIACTGKACAISAMSRMMVRSRFIGSSMQMHHVLKLYATKCSSPLTFCCLQTSGGTERIKKSS